MKKLVVSVLCAVAALVMVSCGSAISNVKAGKPKAAYGSLHAEYTDWQGAAVGAEIPEWVAEVVSAGAEEDVARLVKKDPAKYRVFTVMARGQDLDALKLLTDNFDIQVQVSAAISQNVAQVATRLQEAEGKTSEAEITAQSAQVVDMVNQNLTLNDLERVTSYWTKYYMADKKGNIKQDEAYSYIVVMAMEVEKFNAQLDAAMKKIDQNTSEDAYLRQLSDLVITQLRGQGSMLQGAITADMSIGDR